MGGHSIGDELLVESMVEGGAGLVGYGVRQTQTFSPGPDLEVLGIGSVYDKSDCLYLCALSET